ncbi:MAG TPA: hypothetical protein VM328_11795, partial [Fimbriimonadaceae bacterium]|nr:hypothetical protein [Fimbriimonadaceae bacterium]
MIRSHLQQIVSAAVSSLVDQGRLPEAVRGVQVEITDTRDPSHGDYATNFALTASKAAGTNPRALAEMVAAELQDGESSEPPRPSGGEGAG